MKRLLAVTALLSAHATARADMGMPFDRRIPVRITLTTDPPPPGVVLFVQDREQILQSPPLSPLILESPPGRGGVGFSIYAVPESVVKSWPIGTLPNRDWFRPSGNPDCTFVGGGGDRGRVSFGDNRAVMELQYRLARTADGMRVVFVSDNKGRWWQSGPCCLVITAMPIGLIWLGVRLARQSASRNESTA